MKFVKHLFLLGCLTFFFLIGGDIVSKFAIGLDFHFTRYTFIAKTILLILYLGFFIVNLKEYLKEKLTKQLFVVIFTLCVTFFLANIYPFNYSQFDYWNIEFLVRYLFFPITFLIFFRLFLEKDQVFKLFKYYEWIFLVNLTLIVLGFLLGLEFLKSYPNPSRFGYSGIFTRTNQASYIFILFIAIYYYQVNYLKKSLSLKLILTVLIALLVGTKRIYFFLLILACFHLYRVRKSVKSIHVIISGTIIGIGFVFRGYLYKIFESKFGIFIHLYKEKGFIAAITSYRNETLSNTLNHEIYPNWSFENILFGGSNFTKYRPELDIIDLFLFFGLTGLIVYFIFVKLFLNALNTNRNFIKCFLVILLIISFTSSGFFNSVNIPFIFFLCIFSLKYFNNDIPLS